MNTVAMSSPECPAIGDLLAPSRSDVIQRHIASCPRCQLLLATRPDESPETKSSIEFAGDEAIQPTSAPPPTLKTGSVARFQVQGLNEALVAAVVDAEEDDLVVAPITAETQMAAEWDLLLPRAVLGYEAIVEVWNYGRVLADQLIEPRAEVGSELLGGLPFSMTLRPRAGSAPTKLR